MRQKIFIGSSREALEVSRAVQSELADSYDVTVWNQDVFRLSRDALDSLLNALDSSDAGVFILAPDDFTVRRGDTYPTARDNVTFELGMFLGHLGRDRTFMLKPAEGHVALPSDLLGVTTADYDPNRIQGSEKQAAVGPACTRIRNQLESVRMLVSPEPESRARLDRAMARMSRDLELLLGGTREAPSGHHDHAKDVSPSIRVGRATVRIEVGRIQDYDTSETRTVIALPANEYFDDECVTDVNSSLGAFVQRYFTDETDAFLRRVKAELRDLPTQRVPRAERRVDDSYGIGQTIFLESESVPRVILVSATTERSVVGLRAEPHFLYAAIRGVIETMNANRLNSLVMPVFGSGHGGIAVVVALLFNLLALRSCLTEDVGRNIRRVCIVVYVGDAADVSELALQEIFARVDPDYSHHRAVQGEA